MQSFAGSRRVEVTRILLVAALWIAATPALGSRLVESAARQFVAGAFVDACGSTECRSAVAEFQAECFDPALAVSVVSEDGGASSLITRRQVEAFHACLVERAGRDFWGQEGMVDRVLGVPAFPALDRDPVRSGSS